MVRSPILQPSREDRYLHKQRTVIGCERGCHSGVLTVLWQQKQLILSGELKEPSWKRWHLLLKVE